VRQSELRFFCGEVPGSPVTHSKGLFFHAPLGEATNVRGLENLLNTWGYFVEFGNDRSYRPPFFDETVMPFQNRFRLMELMVPSENVLTYNWTSGLAGTKRKNLTYAGREWFANFINPQVSQSSARPVRVLAENVIAVFFVPKLSKQDEERRTAQNQDPLCKDFVYDSYYNPAKNYPDPEINPSNQLPPIVQVSMVALDEASAARLESLNGTVMPKIGNGLFRDTKQLLNDPATPQPDDGDLQKLAQELIDLKLSYRIFTTDVSIRAAKWSRDQK
jgi:uncharacterized protein (TIGR02599 family)